MAYRISLAIAILFMAHAFASPAQAARPEPALEDVRTSSCAREAVELNVAGWTSATPPVANDARSFFGLFESLRACGMFSASTPENEALSRFARSTFADGAETVSVRALNGHYVIYELNQGDDRRFRISEIRAVDSDIFFAPTQLFPADRSQENELAARMLDDCRMARAAALDAVEAHVRSWLMNRRRLLPRPENQYAGYEALFRDLQRLGAFSPDAAYAYSLFSQTPGFATTDEGVNAELTIRAGDVRYAFTIDTRQGVLIRPPICGDATLTRLAARVRGGGAPGAMRAQRR